MVKATVEEKAKSDEYPCLMISEQGQIILAVSNGNSHEHYSGTNVNGIGFDIGSRSNFWIKSDFKPFHGTITLSNE